MLLLSNSTWQHATLIVSFTCVGIDYHSYSEGWREIEDSFDRIRNCGESGCTSVTLAEHPHLY